MKKLFTTLLVLFCCTTMRAQHYGLFNTKTLFDSFENPAQQHFTIDVSRKFSSNFLFPIIGFNGLNKGGSDPFVRKLIQEQLYDSRELEIGTGKKNTSYQHTNIYLLAFKLYKSYKYNQEIGLSWQLRSDAHLTYTNEAIAFIDAYSRFPDQYYTDPFNADGYIQNYHQLSISYRENIDKKLAVGLKLSLLNGITYNKLAVNNSYLNLDRSADQLQIGFKGTYRSSFFYADDLSKKDLFPLFKNPGVSLTAGFKYETKHGITLMGNIKDLGILRWSKESYVATGSIHEQFNNLNDPATEKLVRTRISKAVKDINQHSAFYSATNAKADFYISKSFGFYTPALVVSKNLFYKGAAIAMVNTLKVNNLSTSIIPTYYDNNVLMAGLQGMYKTDNFEIFAGTDNFLKTLSTGYGLVTTGPAKGDGYNGASFYLGLGVKVGRFVQHPLNSDIIPGVGEDARKHSFLQRLFGKK